MSVLFFLGHAHTDLLQRSLDMASPSKRLQTILGHLKGGEGATVFPKPASASLAPSGSFGGHYKYTLDSTCAGILSQEQREFYEKNGYIVVPRLVSQEKLDIFKERFRAICSREVDVPGLIIMRDVAIAKSEFLQDERAITKIQDFQVYSAVCVYAFILYFYATV